MTDDTQSRDGAATSDLTLNALATEPYWVAWQTESRNGGKPTKVPYAPNARLGTKAKADAPGSWGTRALAEIRASVLPKTYGLGGIGLEFTSLGDGRSLAGIDLDTCRDSGTGVLQG